MKPHEIIQTPMEMLFRRSMRCPKDGDTFNSSTGKLVFTEATFKTALLSQRLDIEAMFADQSSDLGFSVTMEALVTTYTTSSTGTMQPFKQIHRIRLKRFRRK